VGDSHKNKAQGEEDGEGFPQLNVISLLLLLAMSSLASHLATKRTTGKVKVKQKRKEKIKYL
jgi:hypothetical protein